MSTKNRPTSKTPITTGSDVRKHTLEFYPTSTVDGDRNPRTMLSTP